MAERHGASRVRTELELLGRRDETSPAAVRGDPVLATEQVGHDSCGLGLHVPTWFEVDQRGPEVGIFASGGTDDAGGHRVDGVAGWQLDVGGPAGHGSEQRRRGLDLGQGTGGGRGDGEPAFDGAVESVGRAHQDHRPGGLQDCWMR